MQHYTISRRARYFYVLSSTTSFLIYCTVLGTLDKLPGNNPVQAEGSPAVVYPATSTPPLIAPVYAYTGQTPTQTGSIVGHASNIPIPASPSNVPYVPQSASPKRNTGKSSYQVLAPSVPTISKPGAIPPQAGGHTLNIPVSHAHSMVKPVAVSTHDHPSHEDEPCDEDHQDHDTPSSVSPHNHAHAAGGHKAASSNDCSDLDHTPHRGSGSNRGSAYPESCKKRNPRSEERRSVVHHAARSRPNAGHRFLKYHARTF